MQRVLSNMQKSGYCCIPISYLDLMLSGTEQEDTVIGPFQNGEGVLAGLVSQKVDGLSS